MPSQNQKSFQELFQPTNVSNINVKSIRDEVSHILNIIKVRTKHLSGKDLEMLKKYLIAIVE